MKGMFMTRLEECLDLLKKNPTGINKKKIMEHGFTESAVYTAISNLRDKGFKIKCDPEKGYILKTSSADTEQKPTAAKRQYNRRTTTTLPFPMPKNSNLIPADQRERFNEMIGQAAFYYKCAIALIETQQLMKGIV